MCLVFVEKCLLSAVEIIWNWSCLAELTGVYMLNVSSASAFE